MSDYVKIHTGFLGALSALAVFGVIFVIGLCAGWLEETCPSGYECTKKPELEVLCLEYPNNSGYANVNDYFAFRFYYKNGTQIPKCLEAKG